MRGRAFERGDHVELGAALNASLADRDGCLVFADGDTYLYDDQCGVWEQVDPSRQSRIVQGFAGAASGDKGKPLRVRAADVAGAIKLAQDQIARPVFFDEAVPGLAFASGFVRVSATRIEQLQHAAEHRARHCFPFDFDAHAAAPKFLTFLDSLFRDDADRLEKICALQEFAGAALLGVATTYQRAIVNIGGGENGKSKLAEILAAVMPAGSVEAIAPHEWGKETRRAMLAGKRLNVVAELPEADIIAGEAFKSIIAGDRVDGKHLYKSPFTFRPVAGHMFAANNLPGSNDQTEGFWRRMLVIRFNRSFKNDPDRNPHVAEEILDTEKPAIVTWMLRGAMRLMAQREYTLPASHHAELAAWRLSADQVAQFLDERIDANRTGSTPGFAAYKAYRVWAERNGHRALSNVKFGTRLRQLGRGSEHTDKGKLYAFVLTDSDGLLTDNPSANYRGGSYGYS